MTFWIGLFTNLIRAKSNTAPLKLFGNTASTEIVKKKYLPMLVTPAGCVKFVNMPMSVK